LQSDEGDRGTGDKGKNPEMHLVCRNDFRTSISENYNMFQNHHSK
jgi:hypothetical protein